MQRLTGAPALAWAALILTITIWASYLVVARAAVSAAFTPAELGLLRFAPGALLFLPLLIRRGFWPTDPAQRRAAVLIVGFGGVLFVLFLTTGLRFAPVADSGVFTPAMLPFFVALLSWAILGAPPRGSRAAGLLLILLGALAIGGAEALTRGGGAWRGHLLFLCASASWAVYTLAYGRSGLGALYSAALMCFWSAVVFAPLSLLSGADFLRGGWRPLVGLILQQGVLSGFLATITYFFAITRLGPQRPAALAALVPGLAALGGWWFLGEALRPVEIVGLAVVMVGVALAAGALAARQPAGGAGSAPP